MNEQTVRPMALFFFYAISNEVSARSATIKSMHLVSKLGKRKNTKSRPFAAQIVEATNRVWEKHHTSQRSKTADRIESGSWVMPQNLDMGAWKQFSKQAEPDEMLAVVWSKILKFSDEDIAEGLGVTVGSIRHRVGRGLRLLGELKMY